MPWQSPSYIESSGTAGAAIENPLRHRWLSSKTHLSSYFPTLFGLGSGSSKQGGERILLYHKIYLHVDGLYSVTCIDRALNFYSYRITFLMALNNTAYYLIHLMTQKVPKFSILEFSVLEDGVDETGLHLSVSTLRCYPVDFLLHRQRTVSLLK